MSQSDKLGKYEVIRQIAVGAMAELYLARTVGMEGFEKLVCVKRILPQYVDNPSFVNMLLNEARIAATLQHPNIAQVYDIGHEPGEFFVAMEYVHGEDLGRLVATARENGVPVTLDCALTLASGLCAGLHHAHEKASPEGKLLGVVHRDVSPTNVLVSYDGAVKLVDFGIARAGVDPLASGSGMKGKIAYMSPEQCRGKGPLDRRSDVFSVGTILYELTTGRQPFVDATEFGVLQQIVNRDAAPPSTLVPGYPPALEAIVMRALSRDVARRFSTALELQNQLEDFAHDHRLRVSPLVLARLMSTLFPARLEEWDHARAQGAFFVEQHVVRTLIESGKATSGASHYVPQPLPAADEGSGSADGEAPTVPSGRGSAPGIPAAAATQIGPPPVAPVRLPTPVPGEARMPTPAPGDPRMATPAPGEVRMTTPAPGELGRAPAATALSQPRLPTPPPVAGPHSPPGVRYPMPVPNMPGAVPIVTPMMAPPIASAGTLVSSATQAGPSSTPSSPMIPGPGVPGPGLPGMPPPIMGPGAMPVGPIAAAGYIPAAAGDFGAAETGRRQPVMYGYGANDASQIAGMPVAHAVGAPAPVQRRGDARPTLIVRVHRRRWIPITAIATAGGAGAIALVLALSGGGEATPAQRIDRGAAPAAVAPADPGQTEPAAAAPSAVEPRAEAVAAPEAAKPAGEPAPAPSAPVPSAVPAANASTDVAASATAGASTGAAPAPAAPVAAAPAAPAPAPAAAATRTPAAPPVAANARAGAPSALVTTTPASDSKPDATRKRTAKLVSPDPRKPARPKVRPDPRRAEPRKASKPEAKEQPWNDESPFMPVQNQKR